MCPRKSEMGEVDDLLDQAIIGLKSKMYEKQ